VSAFNRTNGEKIWNLAITVGSNSTQSSFPPPANKYERNLIIDP